MTEQVTVQGVGRVEARPDTALVDLGAEGRGESVETALSIASRAITAMAGALREQGLDENDLRTQGPSTYTMTDDAGRVNAYVCSFQLTARVTDTARAGELLGRCVTQAGDAGRVHGVTFVVSERAEHQRQARMLASADARARAEQLAELVGRSLGRATKVTETGSGGGPPRPMHKAMSLSMESAPDVEAGVEQVSVSVEVTWVFAD
ncbi:SIMPL domain-containing protein [soil metagenome]